MNVDNEKFFICGYDDEENDFEVESIKIMGTTPEGYLDAETYINNLEDKIRYYQRRCK